MNFNLKFSLQLSLDLFFLFILPRYTTELSYMLGLQRFREGANTVHCEWHQPNQGTIQKG